MCVTNKFLCVALQNENTSVKVELSELRGRSGLVYEDTPIIIA